VNISNLKRVTSTVLTFKNFDERSFKEFFRWISQSVRVTSAAGGNDIDAGTSLKNLPINMEMATEGLEIPVQRYVFLLARCGKTKEIYVARYEKMPGETVKDFRRNKGFNIRCDRDYYIGVGSYRVSDFDFAESEIKMCVPSDSLLGHPACPYCGNRSWAMCGECLRVFCMEKVGRHQCPWCRVVQSYRADPSFEVGRGLG
jgi:hypothetical protein